MKILNVSMSLDPINGGGAVERTVQVSRALVARGHSCTILTLDIGLTRERVDSMAGVNIIALPCLVERFYLPRFSYSAINRIVAESDIVHLISHWTLLNALVYHCAHRQKKPYVVCPAGALPIFGRSRFIKTLYNKVIGRSIVRNAARCIAITQNELEHFECYGVKAGSIVVIPNGVCEKEYAAKDDEGFRQALRLPAVPLILFVGRLNVIKGPDLLLRAFCAVSKLFPHHLVFVGPDGGMLGALREMARKNNVEDRVHFVGYLGGSRKSQAYHTAELLVIPSRSEAMSIVALEAGAAGTPVLITDQCGFNDIGKIGGGAVVPASEVGITQGLLDLLRRPDDLKAMGNRLREHTRRFFTWEAIVGKYLEVYKNIEDAGRVRQ